MFRKLMIRTWFGAQPPWTDRFVAHVQYLAKYGWDFMLLTDLELFKDMATDTLGIRPGALPGSRKAGDYDPMLGVVLSDFIRGYDYWGHYNLDAVYGRIDRWLPDEFLKNIDIFGNDPGSICGPFSVYRNVPYVNNLFRLCPTWQENVRSPDFKGWDELEFSRMVVAESLQGHINFASGFFTSHDHMTPAHKAEQLVHIRPDGSLIDGLTGKEVMMYHFNQTRRWPVS